MTPVRSVKNQYRGINAHLHSYWQAEGGWDGFHANHIADLMRLMSAQLLPMGYVADIQQSLQIRQLGEPAGRPESDISIFDRDPVRAAKPFSSTGIHVPALALSEVMNLESELATYGAIGIYEYVRGQRDPGEPVAWIELLSPSNKPGGQDAAYYRDKRLKLLQSGMVFVELDYLHETAPTFDGLARYNNSDKTIEQEAGSFAYRVVTVDPRPIFHQGTVYPYEFEVDREIPVVDIPLNGEDVLKFDFQTAYNKTFSETLYGARLVDYSQLPVNYDRYSRDDQIRIIARMLVVMEAARNDLDLEAIEILPTEGIPLDEALRKLKRWG